MMKTVLFALLLSSSAFAQSSNDPCVVPAGTPLPSGCFPLTYKPADGGPERPVFLGFKPGPDLVPVGPVPHGHGGASAAAGRAAELDLGIDASYNHTDYATSGNVLTGGFLTFTGRHIGGEVNVNFTTVAQSNIHENTFLAGPRYNVVNRRLLTAYVKASFGFGHFNGDAANLAVNRKNFFVESYGGGLDLHVSRHMNVRVMDAEYQIWNSFAGSSLQPYTLTSGISFRL